MRDIKLAKRDLIEVYTVASELCEELFPEIANEKTANRVTILALMKMLIALMVQGEPPFRPPALDPAWEPPIFAGEGFAGEGEQE
jgi:hypothetical protein